MAVTCPLTADILILFLKHLYAYFVGDLFSLKMRIAQRSLTFDKFPICLSPSAL